MRRTTLAAVTAAALLALTACSSDDGGDDDKATPATAGKHMSAPAADDRAGLEAAVRDYTTAFFKPDATAGYNALSKRCAAEIDKAAYTTQVETASKQYGAQAVKSFKVDQLSGDMARVSYGVGLPLFDQKQQPWVREGGEWRYDAC
ncbi:hypothetical protein AB0F42_24400 [Streptomyces buecherae]|uniref:hypothetical protein n=1 Tax=Streptomyces buecherae TaxID=2763006 RepID=UPI0033EFE8DF